MQNDYPEILYTRIIFLTSFSSANGSVIGALLKLN